MWTRDSLILEDKLTSIKVYLIIAGSVMAASLASEPPGADRARRGRRRGGRGFGGFEIMIN